MDSAILASLRAGERAVRSLQSTAGVAFIAALATELSALFKRGGKVLIAGNGGSLCDAIHFAEELTGQFHKRRRALPAIALADAGHMSCVGNDFGFDEVFARGVEAYGLSGDLFIGLSTSGNSKNIIRAFEAAKSQGLMAVSLLGKGGGQLKGVADFELIVDEAKTTDRIQEAHMLALHIAIEQLEALLFPELALEGAVERLLSQV